MQDQFPPTEQNPFGGRLLSPIIPSLYHLATVFRTHVSAPSRKGVSKRKRSSDDGEALRLLRQIRAALVPFEDKLTTKGKKQTAEAKSLKYACTETDTYLDAIDEADEGAGDAGA